jgi:hypothetical protein
MTPGPEKRVPGQSNAEYDNRRDPNDDFIGIQSGPYGGGDSSIYRAMRAVVSWLDRRRGRGH